MHILFSIADPDSPFLRWFAELAKNDPTIKLSFLCLYNETEYMTKRMKLIGCEKDVYWIKYLEENRKMEMIRVIPSIYRLIKELQPDIVNSMLFDDTFSVLLAAKLAGVKHRIATKHDTLFHYYFYPKWIYFDRFNNWLATKLIAVASPSRDFIINIEKAPADKVHVIHNGIKVDELTNVDHDYQASFIKRFKLEGKKIVGSIGRLEHNKGYDSVLKAAKKICSEREDVVFMWLGVGSLKESFEQAIQDEGLQGRIILTGWVDEFNVASVIRLFSVLAHASQFETFGLVVVESMLNKVPVVVTNSTGIAVDSIKHLENGFLFDYGNADQLIKGIEYFLDNREEQFLIDNEKLARDNFNVKRMYKDYIAFYRALTSSS